MNDLDDDDRRYGWAEDDASHRGERLSGECANGDHGDCWWMPCECCGHRGRTPRVVTVPVGSYL